VNRTVFEGRRTASGPHVWRIDRTGRYLLSGPASDAKLRQCYDWGSQDAREWALARDLLSSVGVNDELAAHVAPQLADDVLCALPDVWEMTAAQLRHWIETQVMFTVAILPANW
jgi:hypothetical protein